MTDDEVFEQIRRHNMRRFMPDRLELEQRSKRRWRAAAVVLALTTGALALSLGAGKIQRATGRHLQLQEARKLQTQRFTQGSMEELLLELDGRPDDPVALSTAHLIREARRLAAGGL